MDSQFSLCSFVLNVSQCVYVINQVQIACCDFLIGTVAAECTEPEAGETYSADVLRTLLLSPFSSAIGFSASAYGLFQ